MPRGLFIALIVVTAAAGAGKQLATTDRPDAFQDGGDCPYYAAAAESILRDGDLDLRNQLDPDGTGFAKHSGFVAIAQDGETIVLKQSLLMPILSLPSLAAFGKFGLLLYNVTQLGLLVYGVSLLGGDTPGSRLIALAGYLTTPFLPYTFNYSPDVLATALVVWTYVAAARGHWAWCGLLAGLAVWSKPYLGVVLLPAALLVLHGGSRAVLTAGSAAIIGVAPFFAFNTLLFGSPLVTGYDREARIAEDGAIVIADHYSLFHQPILQGLGNLLLDAKLGLLPTAPLWVLWPAGAWLMLRRGRADRRLAAALVLGIAANLLLFARYDKWYGTIHGNRFLFPALAFGLALIGPLADRGWAHLRGLNRRSSRSSVHYSGSPCIPSPPERVSTVDRTVTVSVPE